MKSTGRTYSATWSYIDSLGKSKSVAGSLVVSADNETHVIHLAESLAAAADSTIAALTAMSDFGSMPVLHGETAGGVFTAIGCTIVRDDRSYAKSGHRELVLEPWLVLKGERSLSDPLYVTEVSFQLWDQDAWADWFDITVEPGTPENRTVKVTQTQPETKAVKIDGVEVSIRDTSRFEYFTTQRGPISMEQTSALTLKFDNETPLAEVLSEWVAPLSFWISSGTGRTSGIEEMWIENRNWKANDGSPDLDPLRVLLRNPKRKFDLNDKIEFLHRLPDFDFELQLPKVIAAFREHNTALSQYLDYLHNKPDTPMVRLTVLAQLVETFDRSLNPDPDPIEQVKSDGAAMRAYVGANPSLKRYAKGAERSVAESVRPTLASRLTRLDAATGMWVSELLKGNGWKQSIAAIRNSIVHGLPSSKFFSTSVIPIAVSIDILERLFELRLLVALGFTPVQAKEIVSKDRPVWFQRTHNILRHMRSFDDFNKYAQAPKKSDSPTERDSPSMS